MKNKNVCRLLVVSFAALLTSCGDFPDYRYEKARDSCMLSFPFAAGLIGRKYIGYFNLISTFQYLDANPEFEIFIGEPSHIVLEPGSVQKLEIDDKFYTPKFQKNYMQGEYEYWGSSFTFDKKQSKEIYQALQQGHNITFHGRVEVGSQYETEIYNFFFEDAEAPFKECVNQLLSEDDLKNIQQNGILKKKGN